MSKYVLKIPMAEREKNLFKKAHKQSGFVTMSEFVRYLIRQYISGEGK